MSEREKLKPEEKVKIVIKYIAGEGAPSSGWDFHPRSGMYLLNAVCHCFEKSVLSRM